MRRLCLMTLCIGLSLSHSDANARRSPFALSKIISQAETDRAAAKIELKNCINDHSSRSDRDQAMLTSKTPAS